MARKHLKSMTSKLHIPKLTFYMFRQGGITWAFDHGVDLQNIIVHGTCSYQEG